MDGLWPNAEKTIAVVGRDSGPYCAVFRVMPWIGAIHPKGLWRPTPNLKFPIET
jgi:hypothetical protein